MCIIVLQYTSMLHSLHNNLITCVNLSNNILEDIYLVLDLDVHKHK